MEDYGFLKIIRFISVYTYMCVQTYVHMEFIRQIWEMVFSYHMGLEIELRMLG